MAGNIMDINRITVAPWGWKDSSGLKGIILPRFPTHAVHEWPSPIIGFNLTMFVKFPGKFEIAMGQVIDSQREFIASSSRTVIIGTPLLWLAHYRAAKGVVSSALAKKATDLFLAHDLAALPGDTDDASSSPEGVKAMCATWAFIAGVDQNSLPQMVAIEDFLAD